VPLVDWLDEMPAKVQSKCTERIDRLSELGHELRRPEADFLRDGIYELRASYQGVHYRMLYFFAGKAVVVVSHGLTKEREVPPKEIDLAVKRKKLVEENFKKFTFKPE
jgi:phage-related protein